MPACAVGFTGGPGVPDASKRLRATDKALRAVTILGIPILPLGLGT